MTSTPPLRPLIKGLGPRSNASAEQELLAARTSVLRWWWEYLRLSRDYWMVCQTRARMLRSTDDERLQKVYDNFGDVWELPFDDWWVERGHEAFRELKSPPRVKEVPRRQPDRSRHDYPSDHVWVDIPLTLSRAAITRQINKILEKQEHEEQRLTNRLERSTANFKLTAGRHRLHTLAVTHDVHCLHRELIAKPKLVFDAKNAVDPQSKHPHDDNYQRKADMFRIGRLLKLAINTTIYTDDAEKRRASLNRMRATVGRYLMRSHALIANVEIGNFPSYSALEPNPLRFNRRQLDAHKELEERWWAMELHATMSESRVLDAKRIHYSE